MITFDRFRQILALTITILFLKSSDPVFSQGVPLSFMRYGAESGLSSGTVRSIAQDSLGFMWFGTSGGLVRFDGYQMVNYSFQPGDPESIQSNSVWCLLPVEMNRLLIGTFGGGLSTFQRDKERFQQFPHYLDEGYSLFQRRVTAVIRTRRRALFIGTNGGGIKVKSPESDHFIRYKHVAGKSNCLSSNFVTSILEDKEGYVWIGTNGERLNRLDIRTMLFTSYKHDKRNGASIADNIVTALYEDRSGELWIGTNAGLCRFDRVTNSFSTMRYVMQNQSAFDCNRIQALFEDRKGRFWIGTYGGGLLQFDRKLKHYSRYTYSALDPYSLSDNRVFTIFEDRSGVLWIGTQNGVNKCILDGTGFQYYSLVGGDLHSTSHNDIRSIYHDGGRYLFVGTEGDGVHKFIDDRAGFIAEKAQRPTTTSSSDVPVVSLTTENSNLRLGLFGIGLHVINRQGKTVWRFHSQAPYPFRLNQNDVLVQYISRNGNLWLGTNGGLHCYDVRKKGMSLFLHERDNLQSINDNRIRSIVESDDSSIWIGTENGGLNRLDDPSGVWYREQLPLDRNGGFLPEGVAISCLQNGENGKLWIGTSGYGVIHYDYRAKSSTQFTTRDGLPSNTVYGLLVDKLGVVWITTNKGLCRLNSQNRDCRIYDKSDGLLIEEFNNGAFHQGADGRMYFGGRRGFIVFHPDGIRQNEFIAKIVITDIKLENRSLSYRIDSSCLSASASDAREVTIGYGSTPLTIDFAYLHYDNPTRNQYAYMLEGESKQWIHIGETHSISFSNLSPGDYLLRIKAKNADGVWNEAGFSMTLRVIPPLYLKPWFQWTFGIVLIVSVIVLSYWRAEHVRRKEQNKRRLVESELQALRLQMNPHFIFNSLNSIQHFVMHSDMENANSYLTKFARLMRMILENSKQPTILLSDEIEFLHLYLEIESFRFEGHFQYSINVDPALARDVQIPSMLLQPYIENAIRHGLHHKTGMGSLMIDLRAKDDMVIAVIEDNGIGRMKAMEIKRRQGALYKSFGMDITHDRLEILNTVRKKGMSLNIVDLHDEKGEPSGTSVEIYIPLE